MHLKIDTKQKIKYLRTFLSQLRTSPSTLPFITINPGECGFFDYDYITKRRKTIGDIEKDLKENKYQFVRELCVDLRVLYENVKEYLLVGDRLQDELDKCVREIGEFQLRFSQDFKENRLLKDSKVPKKQQSRQSTKQDQNPQPHPQPQPPKIQKTEQILPPQPIQQYNRKSTFGQKLQMFYYLRTHEDNMEYIKSIGESYGIGREQREQRERERERERGWEGNGMEGDDGEYVIKLDANAGNCLWLELLQKKDM